MLKREDLEELGRLSSPGLLDCIDEDDDAHALIEAAPKLALACLEALALARRVAEHFAETDAPLGIAAQDVRSLLFNELIAAGVEVPDGN